MDPSLFGIILHMLINIYTAFIGGTILGFFGCHFLAERRRRAYLRETSKEAIQTSELMGRSEVSKNGMYRMVLKQVEAGKVEVAKESLADAIAFFYKLREQRRCDPKARRITPVVEAKNVETAMEEAADAIACCCKLLREQRRCNPTAQRNMPVLEDWFEEELQAVERDAVHSEALRMALKRPLPDDVAELCDFPKGGTATPGH